MAAPSTPRTADGPRKAFLALNGIAFALMAVAAVLVYLTDEATGPLGLAALALVLVAIGLAVASYPFYRRFMREELARRASLRRSKVR